MPDLLNPKKAHRTTFNEPDDAPKPEPGNPVVQLNTMGIFFGQEMERMNKLIIVLTSTLSELQKAIKGLVVMSSDLETMFDCFLYNRVPPAWENAGYPSLKPLASWVVDFLKRVEVMRSWLEDGPPAAFWLSGFFFPQGFMTAALQRNARLTTTPIDTIKFESHILKVEKMTDIPEESKKAGVCIYGLFLQGAAWDLKSGRLIEARDGELFAEMPITWLKPVATDAPALEDRYPAPMYKTSLRAGTLSTTGHSTNFVMYMELPTLKTENHWIKRGCALLLQLDS